MERMIGSPLEIAPNLEHIEALDRSHELRQEIETQGTLDGPEHVLIGGRQEGKTWLAETWLDSAPEGVRRVFVTLSTELAIETRQRLGYPRRDPRVITYRQLLEQGAEDGVEYGFDEIVAQLQSMFGLHEPPRLITVCTAAEWQVEA